MQTNNIRIIAAVVDTHNLTLYKENGDTVLIPQGDSRVRTIVDEAVPLLLKQGFADITIARAEDSSYVQFEAQSNGVVKLYRIAKSKLLSLIGADVQGAAEEVAPVVPMAIGMIPSASKSAMSAVEEIMHHAVSVNSPEFHEEGIHQQGNVVEEGGHTISKHPEDTATDTIIAVVEGKIIPGMEKIKTQFSRAAKLGSTVGVENFLKRLGSVIGERKHSVEDLLKFMERGDLPIADDGSILIYKVLNRSSNKVTSYVDCHSKRVEQWVGAYVCMDASLVDHNRSNECSNGLHVARRGYVREFSGDVCVLAKLAPEDVIAVPSYDANKMRVCGYHIIAELTKEQYALVKQNKPITDDPDGKVLLGKALAGVHISKTHEVRITGSMGQGVKVTELSKQAKPEAKGEAPVAEALSNPGGEKATPVDPKDVVKQVEQVSRKDQAVKLYADYKANKPGAFEALLAFKKAAKVSWEKLGIPAPAEWPTMRVGDQQVPVEIVIAETTPVKEEAKTTLHPGAEHKVFAVPVPREAKIQGKTASLVIIDEVDPAPATEGSPRERIQKLLATGITSAGVAQAILNLKKSSKKSWEVLGVNSAQVTLILSLTK